MDQLVQCPVCTLFLHNGMSLESHLDTHPKDQVIKALCNLSKNANYGSRTPTPSHSERSYRSRSRTPATEDSNLKWNGSRSGEHERYWRRTPSRTPSRTPKASNCSRVTTPASDVRLADISFENSPANNSNSFSSHQYPMKIDKTQQTFIPNPALSDFDQPYVYYQDQQEDREIKYSRSAEYGAIDNSSNVFAYNMPVAPAMKLPPSMLPAVPRKGHDLVKLLPKPNNLLVKTNMGGVQYLSPGVKPMHVMVPTTPTFVQKNVQNNMIMTSNLPTSQMLDNKAVSSPLPTSQFNQISSGAFTPGTTVVTQNSQIIYREMVHNIDGKPFISSMPAVLSGHENVTNVAQTSSMYQNVMVVDQFGNTSCMYTSPQQLISNNMSPMSTAQVQKADLAKSNAANEFNKTLIIEVGPILPPEVSTSEATVSKIPTSTQSETPRVSKQDKSVEKPERNDTPGPTKGLKILSNIKVEVPVQHHKNMLNTILDLTGPNDTDFQERPISPEKILPDLDDNNHSTSNDSTALSTANSSADSLATHSFSVIKNVGNPPSYKEATKSGDSKIDNEFSDSCPVPDLICNEKPSISPCSELSEHGDNSRDIVSISPKPEMKPVQQSSSQPTPMNAKEYEPRIEQKAVKVYSNPLRLNNIYVKKNKKVLQIKNAKSTAAATISKCVNNDPVPSSSVSKAPENFTMNKLHQENRDTLQTVSIERIKENDDQHEFDADTEEQSMDIESVPPSSLTPSQFATSVDIVQVKEEINTSNESAFSNEAGSSDRHLTPLEGMRPINVITYGNMPPGDFDDESNHRELLDLEAASKSKQFVNMMNENYFGDNIYADYFTPDRVESFDDREPPHHSVEKEGMYIWGEPSQKGSEGEFVLPNFIHESYKIAESNYSEMEGNVDGDGCERDSKADVLSEGRSESEPTLNICADEKMPPRGELSGQESNGDMESPWNGMYPDVPPAEAYDLMARESWVSDGSDVDATEKRETLDDDLQFTKTREDELYPKRDDEMFPKRDEGPFPKARMHTCTQCGAKYPTLKELRGHKALVHALPTSSGAKTSYSRMVTARTIKKEEKTDDNMLGGTLLSSMDNKEALASTMLTVYEAMAEAKPKIESLIKQETKRRRKDYVCPTCKVDQVSEALFHSHLKLHPLECLTCGKCFYRRANLQLHLNTHRGVRNYKCEICEKRFVTRTKLREHHNTHSGRAPVKCTHCDCSFRRYSNMVQHRDRHHYHKKIKIRDYVCHCGAIYHSKAKLLWHKETHDEKPKSCLYCSEKFVHSSSLTRHVRRTHNEYYVSDKNKGKVENVTCPVCKQVYLRTNLRAHLLTHSGKRPHLCIICNKSFTTKWNLKLHRWTHMSRSAKPFKCSLCKGAFIRQTEYISHMNAHKSVRPYTCNYCGCQFIRKYNCQRHVREHEMAKKYVCKVPECGKSFHRSYYLSEHMKVHSGARPFSCSICGKTSSNKSNHNKHLKIHHAREPIATEA